MLSVCVWGWEKRGDTSKWKSSSLVAQIHERNPSTQYCTGQNAGWTAACDLSCLSFFQVCGLGRKSLPHTRKLLWCAFRPHGSSRTVTSPYCVTWRSWAVVWSTALRPSSTVSISSGLSRSSLGMECLCLTRTPTVRDHLSETRRSPIINLCSMLKGIEFSFVHLIIIRAGHWHKIHDSFNSICF